MPQMSPMMWIPMLMLTTTIILQINSMTMFEAINMNLKKTEKKKKNESKKKKMNWKW